MADEDRPLGRAVCEVHGEPLLDDTLPVFEAWCVEPDLSAEEIGARHFPHAETFVWGTGLPDPFPVRYCPACRDAEAAWSSAPGDWTSKAGWMRLGFDPYRGTPLTTPEATLVDDYVWIEKWVRAVEGLGLLPWMVSLGSCRTIEEYVLREVEAARAEGAPLDAVCRRQGAWQTVAQVRQEVVRGALGLELP